MSARFIVADVFDGLASLPDASVDLVMTSPPFLALRSYLPADHPDKGREIGSEATPGEFLDVMLDVVEACARVLAPHGSLVFELGDTYAGSGGAGGDYSEGGLRDGAPGFSGSAKASRSGWHRLGDRAQQADQPPNYRKAGTVASSGGSNGGIGWPLDKSKVLVPQLFAIALAYGFNPLTGRQTEPWRVRNVVAWCRPNPPVGRDGDKFRPATSFLTVACKARDRYWDGDAVRTEPMRGDGRAYSERQITSGDYRGDPTERPNGGRVATVSHPAGAPLLDYWEIPTEPYKGSHYATFPRALVVPVVKSMCPLRVCRVCGEPSRRITTAAEGYAKNLGSSWADRDDGRGKAATTERNRYSGQPVGGHIRGAEYETVGWSDCGHGDYRPGHVLDCFGGSGTTALVATGHGLDCTLIDLDARNAELARERVGMWLEVEELA